MRNKPISLLTVSLFVCISSATVLADAQSANNEISGRQVFYKAGSSPIYDRGDMLSEIALTADQTEGRYTIVKEIFKAGMDAYAWSHKHKRHSEVFMILSGKMQWTVNGETRILTAGDVLYIPPNSPHGTKVIGDEDVHAIMLYEPGGYENGFFKINALTEEDWKNKELIRQLNEERDVIPAKVNP